MEIEGFGLAEVVGSQFSEIRGQRLKSGGSGLRVLCSALQPSDPKLDDTICAPMA